MSDETSHVPLDGGQETWDLLAARIEGLIQRWESSSEPPALAEFVPADRGPVRRLLLVELIKVDLDYRQQRQQPRRIEDYLSDFSDLVGSRGVPIDLIFEEFQIRRRAGEPVDPREYFHRFPDQREELGRLLKLNTPTEVTLSHRPRAHLHFNVGDRLDDFTLQMLLGEGAFARVFLAWQGSMPRRVALKVSSDKGDEHRTLAQLDHPHIVRVFDQRHLADQGLRLLYMDFVPGGTLHEVVRRVRETSEEERNGHLLLKAIDDALSHRGEPQPADSINRQRLGQLSWAEVVGYLGARLAEALQHAHDLGVLHRDIKPANVLLGADASPKLADFNVGVSTKLEGASPSAFFGGSLPYMSPEQMEAFNPRHPRLPESLDGRCDVYSLGVTLWELLTGFRPFRDERMEGGWSETLPPLIERRMAGPDAEALRQLPAEMPPGLRDVLVRSLAGDPDQRFSTAGEFARQLELCLRPVARNLLYPPGGWQTWVQRHPVIALYLTGMIPAALASAFSIAHNLIVIVGEDSAQRDRFWSLVHYVNGALFPLGFITFWLAIRPVIVALKRVRRGEQLSSLQADRARHRTVWIGVIAASICLSGFVLGGFVFPICLDLRDEEVLHFLAAQVLCGFISFSYPLATASFLAQRCLYPRLLPGPCLPSEDGPKLRTMDRLLTLGLILSALVPLLSVGFFANGGQEFRWWMIGLSAAGALGFGLVYWIVGLARADTLALFDLRMCGKQ